MAETQEWDEWLALFASRDEVADAYAGLLRTEPGDWSGWCEVNAVIVRRWSLSALDYIKRQAWKLATQEPVRAAGEGDTP